MSKKLIFALVILIAGCAGTSPQAPATQPGVLPPLPQENTAGDYTPPERGSSTAVDIVIPGSDYYAKNESSVPAAGMLDLIQGSEPYPWAIYTVSGIAADYAPTSLSVLPSQTQAEYYVALANYAAGFWEFYPVQTGEELLAVGPYADYRSPLGNFYFAVLVSGTELVTLEHSTVTLEDTRGLPAPEGLVAEGKDAAVQLSWNSYGDERADELRIYRSLLADMGGAVLETTVPVSSTEYAVGDLDNGTTYYFALTAYWPAGTSESGYSNIEGATPQQAGALTLSGIWPRVGNTADNGGATGNLGPPNFDSYVSVDLAPPGTSFKNRTTPVIDSAGSVYALSADAVLYKYSADLSTQYWSFAAADFGTPGAEYMCPPHSPIIDSAGNSYFVAAPDASPAAVPYVFSVTPDGEMNWRFDAISVEADVDSPYPTPNIATGSIVVALVNNKQLMVGIDEGGAEAWSYDFAESREVHANPAVSSRGTIEMPVWFSGIGIDPREHWISLDEGSGAFAADYKSFGGPANVFSGLPLPGSLHIYPEQTSLILLDAVTGNYIDSIAMVEPLTSSPARSVDTKFIFQAHPPYGFSGRGDMRCYVIDDSLPALKLDLLFIQQLNEGSLTSQPAVDARNTIFMPDGQGVLYRIEFDESLPVGAGNPTIADSRKLNATDSYFYNSFALGSESAYIIAENNMLYCIWNPLD